MERGVTLWVGGHLGAAPTFINAGKTTLSDLVENLCDHGFHLHLKLDVWLSNSMAFAIFCVLSAFQKL